MEAEQYKIELEMGWKFIVNANDREDALVKVGKHLKILFTQDGYSTLAHEAMNNLDTNQYSIEEYLAFIIE